MITISISLLGRGLFHAPLPPPSQSLRRFYVLNFLKYLKNVKNAKYAKNSWNVWNVVMFCSLIIGDSM